MRMKRSNLLAPMALVLIMIVIWSAYLALGDGILEVENVIEWHNRGATHVPKYTLCIFADDAFRSFVKNYFCSLKQALTEPSEFGMALPLSVLQGERR